MNLEGYQFTLECGYGTSSWIEERLDRALASGKFFQKFTDMKLTNLEISTSDHTPIFLEPVVKLETKHIKRFQFENVWLCEPMCQEIVKETWFRHEGRSLQKKLCFCAEILSEWGKEITCSFKSRIKHHKTVMEETKGRRDSRSVQQYIDSSKQLTEAYSQQEVFWKQRSKQLWLREGNHNSKFFHSSTESRRKRNIITSLVNEEGHYVGWGNGHEETMKQYFNDLFTASNTNWTEVISCISKRITEDQNRVLLIDIEKQEVKQALFSMHPD